LRGPCGAQDEFTLAAIAQKLRRLASWLLTTASGLSVPCVVVVVSFGWSPSNPQGQTMRQFQRRQLSISLRGIAGFRNKICQCET
jgi:hypothetical protein